MVVARKKLNKRTTNDRQNKSKKKDVNGDVNESNDNVSVKKPNDDGLSANEEKIPQTKVKNNWALSSKSVTKIAKILTGCNDVIVKGQSARQYDEFLIGALGCHYSLTIDVLKKKEQNEESLHAFVKTMPFRDDFNLRHHSLDIEYLFDKELYFYNTISRDLYEHYKGKRWSPINCPVPEKMLVLEDLKLQGFEPKPFWLDCEAKMKGALAALARFHGSFIVGQAYRDAQYSKNSSLADKYKHHLHETAIVSSGPNHEFLKAGIELACEIHSQLMCDSYYDVISEDMKRVMYGIFSEVETESYSKVICHGDLWWSNLLIKDAGRRPYPECRLVDFQMIRHGPQVHDVLQLIYLHSTRQWRDRHETRMLEHYQRVIEQVVRASEAADYAKLLTLDELRDDYEQRRIYGLIMGCLYLPLCLMDGQYLNARIADRRQYEDFTWRNRTEITLDYLRQNEEVARRIKEVVLETRDYCEAVLKYNEYQSLTVMDRSPKDDCC